MLGHAHGCPAGKRRWKKLSPEAVQHAIRYLLALRGGLQWHLGHHAKMSVGSQPQEGHRQQSSNKCRQRRIPISTAAATASTRLTGMTVGSSSSEDDEQLAFSIAGMWRCHTEKTCLKFAFKRRLVFHQLPEKECNGDFRMDPKLSD